LLYLSIISFLPRRIAGIVCVVSDSYS